MAKQPDSMTWIATAIPNTSWLDTRDPTLNVGALSRVELRVLELVTLAEMWLGRLCAVAVVLTACVVVVVVEVVVLRLPGGHTVLAMLPDDPENMESLAAWDDTHAVPHNACVNDLAWWNMCDMLRTRDTSHSYTSALKDLAAKNIYCMNLTCDTTQPEMSALNDVA